MSSVLEHGAPFHLGNGRFAIGEVLGIGGVGIVYRAHDTERDAVRAMKVLSQEAIGTVLEKRFLREAVALQSVQHPNVVKVHSMGRDEPFVWIAMELVEGGTAHQWLRARGALPVRESLRIVDALLDGLGAVHDRGWVHRDVKPGNVLLSPDGAVKLSDFGVVRDFDSDITSPGVALGTTAFMSPEQMDDPTAVTPRSDLYSVGATLFALATGRAPRSLDGDGVDLAPARIRPLLQRACAPDPADRYADAAEMRAAVQALSTPTGRARSTAPPASDPPATGGFLAWSGYASPGRS
jgi:serine/threonine-protein kinase